MRDFLLQVQEEITQGLASAFIERKHWNAYDPNLIAEALFAAANIFSALKLVFIFSINPYLGPLQISLGKSIDNTFDKGFLIRFEFVFCNILVLNKERPTIELLSLWATWVQAESLFMSHLGKHLVKDSKGQFLQASDYSQDRKEE